MKSLGKNKTKTLIEMWEDRTIIGKKVKCNGITRIVDCCTESIYGGVRLDKPVDGFNWWNIDTLILVRK